MPRWHLGDTARSQHSTQGAGCSQHSLAQQHTRLQGGFLLKQNSFHSLTSSNPRSHTRPEECGGALLLKSSVTPCLQHVLCFSLCKALFTDVSWDVFSPFFCPQTPPLSGQALPVTEHHDHVLSRFTVCTVNSIAQYSRAHFTRAHPMLSPTQILKRQGNAKQVGAF